MLFSTLLPFVTLAAMVAAHPGDVDEIFSEAEIARRELAAQHRHLAARSCAGSVAAFNAKRKARRALAKRQVASSTTSASSPHFTELQNFTCITAPEVTEGPYYINNELVRGNLTETQPGISLILDIGVLDITTCEPLPNAFVEIWSANATGVYGSYSATLSGLPPPPSSTSGGSSPTDVPGGAFDIPLVRNETFLRGGLATDNNGIVELVTIYPGFYEGRTAHIHTMIHLNTTEAANGTLISHSGSLIHIGQFFFNESWNDQVYSVSPYTTNTNNRTLNTGDDILAQENSDGNNAYLDLELLGDDISEGILGYITVGVNSSASYDITNSNYLNSTGPSA